jgi:hypothetical protein
VYVPVRHSEYNERERSNPEMGNNWIAALATLTRNDNVFMAEWRKYGIFGAKEYMQTVRQADCAE